MALTALFLTLFFCLPMPHAEGGEPDWKGQWKDINELASVLSQVPEGRRILSDAKAKDPDFLGKIRKGKASFTESTFARTYSLLDGKEQIELRHEITLNESMKLGDAVVDLAHELVHFTGKEMLDPYQTGFELKEFVRRGIEGGGGELAALEKECWVAWALKKKFAAFPKHWLCAPYRSEMGFDKGKALADYYALGSWMRKAPETLRKNFPNLSDRPVIFTSSYARKPYPIALSEEYEATREAACANNRKKYRLISAQAESGRAPAFDQLQREKMRLRTWQRINCAAKDSKK